MSLFGNLFHSIANVFDHNDNNQKKKQQQQQNNQSQKQTAPTPAQKQSSTEQIQPSQPATPNLNLTPLQKVTATGPKNAAGIPTVSTADLKKVATAQQQAQAAEAAAPKAPDDPNSLGYRLTHNAVTDLAGSVVKPTAEFAHAAVEAPHAIVREVQDKPITDIQQNVFGTNDQGKILKKIVGDTINTGLLAGGGEIEKGAETVASKVLPDATSTVLKKVVPKVVAGATGGAAFGANSTAEEGGDVKQTLESAAKNAVIGGATAGFFSGIPVLRKAVANKLITPEDAEAQTKVAEGVHTVNPSRPDDAAAQVGQTAPVPSAIDDAAAAPPVAAPAEPIDPSSVPPEAAPLPADAGNPPAETAPTVAEPTPQPGVGRTAANAPGIRKSISKTLNATGKTIEADGGIHSVFSNPELSDLGTQHADTFTDQGIVRAYQNGYEPHGASDLARGKAALDRLNSMKQTPAVTKAIDNLVAGSEKEFSSGGRTTNYAQEFYKTLKGPAKTSWLIRQIDKVREDQNLPLLKDNVDLKSGVEGNLNHFVNNEETIKGKIANIEQRTEELKQEAQNGNGSKQLTKEATTLNATNKAHQLELSKNTSDLAKYYSEQAPQKAGLGTRTADLGRSLMLTSGAGRVNDVLTTGINSGHSLLTDAASSTLGKVFGRKSGNVVDTLPSPAAVVRGVKYGAKKSVQRFKGDAAEGSSTDLLKKGNTGGKGGLLTSQGGFTGGLRKVVRSATEVATDLSEGVKEAKVQQLASQQGKQLGLKGDDLKTYTAASTAAPTRKMLDAGEQLKEQVNNMHDNRATETLDKFAKALDSIPVVGKQARNLVLPFTRWTGGQLHNAVADKNVVANLAQLAKASWTKDSQAAADAGAKLAVNGAATIGLGYGLAKSGLITHQNAQGYNDDGTYLHLGDRYIPATFLGFFAPGIIMGAAAHDAMKSNGGGKGDILKTTLDATVNTLKDSYYAYGGQSLSGQDNQVIQAIQNPSEHGGSKGVAATIGAGEVGQYVPAATGDINSFLNNGVPGIKGSDALNPTHEQALTKVEKGGLTATGRPSTAKDTVKSSVNQVLNKVPVESQRLPRNAGTAAPDEIDRVLRGDRETTTEVKAAKDKADAVQTSADLKKAGIPDPNAKYATGDSFDDAVENRVENKHYDQAISGLKLQLQKEQKAPDSTSKKTDPIEKQIKQITVLKQGSYDPDVRDLYKSTSLTDWRNMGDPDSDEYDPATYTLLFNYDKDLAANGVSGSTVKESDQKYSAKTSKSGSGSSSGSRAAAKAITSNTLGSTPDFTLPDIGLTPQKITSAAAQQPTILPVEAGQLIKKRAISVGKA